MTENFHVGRLFAFTVSVLLLLAGCVRQERSGSRRPSRMVRVALVRGAGEVTLGSTSLVTITDAESRKVVTTVREGEAITIRLSPEGMNVAGTIHPCRRLQITSTSKQISVNGKDYPGSLRVIRRVDGLLVVNVVGLDSYLKAVVPSEMPPSWPEEALKAQAVVSRSFVLWHALQDPKEDYDILSGAQRYTPQNRDRRTDSAVSSTRDLVLFYEGEPLLSYFCTCCGGFTEFPSNVWETQVKFPPPVECRFCREVPGYKWQVKMPLAEFQRKLAAAGVVQAESIAVHRRSTAGGRVTALKIRSRGGDNIVGINRFRMLMGPNVVRSGFFELDMRDGSVVLKGQGWGHGVGMCQRGAKVLAERGRSFQAILRYYFPGAATKKMRW